MYNQQARYKLYNSCLNVLGRRTILICENNSDSNSEMTKLPGSDDAINHFEANQTFILIWIGQNWFNLTGQLKSIGVKMTC